MVKEKEGGGGEGEGGGEVGWWVGESTRKTINHHM